MKTPAPSADPRVVIVVPFTVWNDLVADCVAHCCALDYSNFVLLLVPNEPTGVPAEVGGDPRILVRPSGSYMMSCKRNLARVAVPDAEFVACIDSDAYPERDWLSQAVELFDAQPETWVVTGPNLSPDYRSLRKRAVANALKSPVVGASRAFMKRRGEASRHVTDVWTCNAIFRAEVWTELGGFDEGLFTAEDTDLAQRVLGAGKRLFYSDTVRVIHHNRPLFLPYLQQKMVAGFGALTYIRRHFGVSVLFCFLPVLALFFFAFGWLARFVVPYGGELWGLGCSAYGIAVLVEAIRWSTSIREVPATAIAVLIGNLGPGIGLILALFRIPFRTHRVYTNFQPEHLAGSEGNGAEGG